eukprot:403339515
MHQSHCRNNKSESSIVLEINSQIDGLLRAATVEFCEKGLRLVIPVNKSIQSYQKLCEKCNSQTESSDQEMMTKNKYSVEKSVSTCHNNQQVQLQVSVYNNLSKDSHSSLITQDFPNTLTINLSNVKTAEEFNQSKRDIIRQSVETQTMSQVVVKPLAFIQPARHISHKTSNSLLPHTQNTLNANAKLNWNTQKASENSLMDNEFDGAAKEQSILQAQCLTEQQSLNVLSKQNMRYGLSNQSSEMALRQVNAGFQPYSQSLMSVDLIGNFPNIISPKRAIDPQIKNPSKEDIQALPISLTRISQSSISSNILQGQQTVLYKNESRDLQNLDARLKKANSAQNFDYKNAFRKKSILELTTIKASNEASQVSVSEESKTSQNLDVQMRFDEGIQHSVTSSIVQESIQDTTSITSEYTEDILSVLEAPFLPRNCALSHLYQLNQQLPNLSPGINYRTAGKLIAEKSKKITKNKGLRGSKSQLTEKNKSQNIQAPCQIQQNLFQNNPDFIIEVDPNYNNQTNDVLNIKKLSNSQQFSENIQKELKSTKVLQAKNSQKSKKIRQKGQAKGKSQNKDVSSGMARNRKYQCMFCKKKFKICAALGGHISKAHPGQSQAYNHKKQVREERELERCLHKDAMQFYFEKFNNVQGFENNILNRNTIKRIKKLLVYQREDYSDLRDKYLSLKLTQPVITQSDELISTIKNDNQIQNEQSLLIINQILQEFESQDAKDSKEQSKNRMIQNSSLKMEHLNDLSSEVDIEMNQEDLEGHGTSQLSKFQDFEVKLQSLDCRQKTKKYTRYSKKKQISHQAQVQQQNEGKILRAYPSSDTQNLKTQILQSLEIPNQEMSLNYNANL